MTEPIRILLVEDEQFLRELYERTLTKAGYAVTAAWDGQMALELSTQKPTYNLILLDIMLPKMHGIDVLKLLKGHDETKNIPVILITNLGQEGVIKEAFKLGAQGYIMKMRVTPYEMAQKVEDFLENPDMKLNPENITIE